MAERSAKNRGNHRKGERHYRAKLQELDVLMIRVSTERQVDLAAKYGVSQTVISGIQNRKIWKSVE
jgi:hypothetical protein